MFRIPVEQYLDAQSMVTLMKIDENGQALPIARLSDDGNLYNGDELHGDGVYSTLLAVGTTETGEQRYRAELKHADETSVSSDIVVRVVKRSSPLERTAYIELINKIQKQESELSAKEMVGWLTKQPEIDSAGESATGGSVWYTTKQGTRGALLLGEAGSKGATVQKWRRPSPNSCSL
ncbi:hypothetical protein DNH61_03850 [Paenibacillus sambharensis]|uniref:Uncharacterized protein n=1 Tax=Paenibacillus sambharensis TaxID=1803190 RepID=A0A2W1LDQ5_9BACL|nr:hypothetical protein [Paenibacillus sambharensis]PZD97216.1 hypothetical protein DNH61_03850 [Paenibacillus sambharensis]